MTLVRTDPADPNRCQGTARHGQCPNLAEHGAKYCAACGGISTKERDETRSYLIAQAETKRRLAQLDTQFEPVRDLQRAISLTHLLIERRLDLIKDETSLLAACGPLQDLLKRMESLSKTLVTVQEKLHALLPREAVLSLGQSIVQIVIEELQGVDGYEEIVDRIINRIFPSINQPKLLEAPSNA